MAPSTARTGVWSFNSSQSSNTLSVASIASGDFGADVAEVLNKNLHQLINQRARFSLADIGQLFEFGLAWHAAVPAIRLLGIGMNAECRHLCAISQKLDFLVAAVACNQIDDKLGE